MAPLRIFHLLSLLSSAALASGNDNSCAANIRIDAPNPEAKRLRALLAKSSLVELNAKDCAPYVVRLARTKPSGYALTLSDATHGTKRTRQVSSLNHASTWLEAWSQSGFAALEESDESDTKPEDGSSVAAPNVSALARDPVVRTPPQEAPKPNDTSEASGAGTPFSLRGGPIVFLTERGNGLLGGQIAITHREKGPLEVDLDAGFATQVFPGNITRRLYWVGPELGVGYSLGKGFSTTPALGVGIIGTTARSNVSATALGGYVSVGNSLTWRMSSKISSYVGAELRLVSAKLLGDTRDRTVETESDDGETESDDGETETATSSTTLEPSSGVVHVGLRVGVTWDLGDLT
jgi:hypothetical protein